MRTSSEFPAAMTKQKVNITQQEHLARPVKRQLASNEHGQDPQARDPLPSKKIARAPAGKASCPDHNMALIPQEAHPEQQESPKYVQQVGEAGGPGPHQSVYHTKQQDGILICDNFLLGKCENGSLCSYHHTPQPYLWQLRLKAVRQWASLEGCAAEQLERLYCNMKDRATLKSSKGSSCVLNLDTLKLTSDWIYDKVRRLSNTSDPEVNPYFPTQWSVYWQNGNCWEKYEEATSLELEGAFQKGMWNHAFQIEDRIYNADLKEFTQTNIKTKYKRGLRHRPTFRTHTQLLPYLSSPACSESVHGICPQGAVPVASSEAAFARIFSDFHRTLPTETYSVCTIYRIQNKWLLQKYRSQKKFMSQGLTTSEKRALEKQLYHGTDQQCVQAICRMNFDPRVAGTHGAFYGQGSYFARNASYSHNYTSCGEGGHRYMLLAKVLVGKSAPGDHSYRRPPVLDSLKGTLYDSCVDSLSWPEIFVVFDSCQCYPSFLICYKMLSDPVMVE
ncbi:protein mono-ADP-ribosyltransferase TIPARP [Microcaecilia unicolor]|uniref:Protein mono-ADP-ribosyltransferase TIPARP-like n=1 Tax=Microcaecilia unicolor TaxID=1415580 RepID=A0A6P7WQI3_9AMPH|nr:protein mono-ADP-ribosyltransferase TIPARP-like [Microcaecilia unicolor]